MLAGHVPFGMNESGFTGVQKVDSELGRKFWWCFGTGPKVPERELSEGPRPIGRSLAFMVGLW